MISRQGDAPDVVNYEEYKELVKNTILSALGGKPVVIFVEMPNIEKSAKQVVSTGIYVSNILIAFLTESK